MAAGLSPVEFYVLELFRHDVRTVRESGSDPLTGKPVQLAAISSVEAPISEPEKEAAE